MTSTAASGRPLPMWDAEVTKLTLAANELSPAVRSAISAVLAAVLAERSLSALETSTTEALLRALRHDPSRREGPTAGARRIIGFATRTGDRGLAVA